MGRVISVTLVATDRMSRAMRSASNSADKLDGSLGKLGKRSSDLGAAALSVGKMSAALAAVPSAAPIIAGVGALAPAFLAAGAGAGSLAAVAVPSINRVKAAIEAQKAAALGGKAAQAKLNAAMKDLGPSGQALMKSWTGLSGAFNKWQRSMEPKVLPLLTRGIGILRGQLPSLTPLVNGASKAVGSLLTKVAAGAKSAGFAKFKQQLTALVPTAIKGFGNALGGVIKGLGGVIQAFMPYAPGMLGLVNALTSKFAAWGTGLGASPGFQRFMAYVVTTGPTMKTTITAMADALKHVAEALIPLGGSLGMGVVSSFGLIAKAISGLSPGQVQGIATAFVAYKTAMAGITAVTAVTDTIGSVTDAVSGGIEKFQMAKGAITDFVGGFRDVSKAYQDGASKAATMGAALKSQIMLWRQQAAAQNVSTARIILNAAAQKIAAAATRVWAAAQAAFNAVMSANPIALIIIALVALGVAIFIAYKRSATFRAIVQATWAGIKMAVAAAWAFIKPILIAIWTAVSTYVVAGFKTLWSWAKIIWPGIHMAIRIAWFAIRLVWFAIRVYIVILIAEFKIIWAVAKLVWSGIMVAVRAAWAIIRPIFVAIKAMVNVLAVIFRWLYNSVIKPTWTLIKQAIVVAWSGIKVVFNAIKSFLVAVLSPAFRAFKIAAVVVWNALKAAISAVWNSGIKPVFNAIKLAVHAVGSAFSAVVSGIRTVWDKLRDITRKPVSFFVNTVYKGGIVRVWNAVKSLVPALPGLPDVPSFRSGGVLPGYAPGRDSVLAMLSPGEGILRPEAVKALGHDFIHRTNAAAKGGGIGGVSKILGGYGDPGGLNIPGFKDGGIVGMLKKPINWAKHAGSAILSKGANWVAESILKPILSRIPHGDGLLANAMTAIPRMAIQGFLDFIKKTVAPNIGGGGSSSAVAAARSQIGLPYTWGGGGLGGPSRGFAQGANTVGFDCSSLMEYAWGKASGGKDITRTTGSQRGFLRTIANPVPGAVGQPHAGHTYMYSGNGHIVEAAHTGTNIRETSVRGGEWWGMPPWTFDNGGILPTGMSTVYNGTGRPEPLTPAHRGSGEIHLHNHGVIGSQVELDRWLTRSMERLRRHGKLPSA